MREWKSTIRFDQSIGDLNPSRKLLLSPPFLAPDSALLGGTVLFLFERRRRLDRARIPSGKICSFSLFLKGLVGWFCDRVGESFGFVLSNTPMPYARHNAVPDFPCDASPENLEGVLLVYGFIVLWELEKFSLFVEWNMANDLWLVMAEPMRHLKIGNEKDSQESAKGGTNLYPARPGEPDCSFYARTGLCNYGNKCKYNHPPVTMEEVPLIEVMWLMLLKLLVEINHAFLVRSHPWRHMRRIMLLKPEVIVSCRELIAKMNFHKEMVNLIARYIILENHVHFFSPSWICLMAQI